jgi:hypothetical protein
MLLDVCLGQRERHEDWLDMGRNLTQRGLRCPLWWSAMRTAESTGPTPGWNGSDNWPHPERSTRTFRATRPGSTGSKECAARWSCLNGSGGTTPSTAGASGGWPGSMPPLAGHPPSAEPPGRKVRNYAEPALGRWKPAIDAMLEADRTAPRKQRHTAHRIWSRLTAEHGAEVSERTVRAYVRRRRRQMGGVKEVRSIRGWPWPRRSRPTSGRSSTFQCDRERLAYFAAGDTGATRGRACFCQTTRHIGGFV